MTEIGLRVLQPAWLMAAAYAANMVPLCLRYWRGWNPPLQRHLFGAHKTVPGFAAGVLAALAVARLQTRVGWTRALVAPCEWAAAGLALGFGVMAGDAVKSSFKRRRGRPPGTPCRRSTGSISSSSRCCWSRRGSNWARRTWR
ncbi:MAG TPA: CDP-archaeol synthase [Mizugakiibacter sp.]